MTGKELAIIFHNTYEELAPNFGYETRQDTKQFDEESANGKLMITVCEHVLELLTLQNATVEERNCACEEIR